MTANTMEHLQAADGHSVRSWIFYLTFVSMAQIGNYLANNWMLILSAIGILINAGFTLDKWYQMRKLLKSGKKIKID